MWMSADDARSDFILAAAAALLGPFVAEFVADLPLYPDQPFVFGLLGVGWILAITGLVPFLLARYRNQALEAFGLDGGRAGLSTGVIVAAPIVLASWVQSWRVGLGFPNLLLGNLGHEIEFGLSADLQVVLALQLAAAFVGPLLLYTFLTTRGRDGFRQTPLPLVEALRTFGMGAVGLALLFALLDVVRPRGGDFVTVVLPVVGLLFVVLLTDRSIGTEQQTGRATILAPAIVAVVLFVFRSGGIFRGDLITGLYRGALAGGIALVVAVLLQTRERAWAAVPIMLAAAFWGTALRVF